MQEGHTEHVATVIEGTDHDCMKQVHVKWDNGGKEWVAYNRVKKMDLSHHTHRKLI